MDTSLPLSSNVAFISIEACSGHDKISTVQSVRQTEENMECMQGREEDTSSAF